MRSAVPHLLLVTLLVTGCAPVRSVVSGIFPGRAARTAGDVTVHRDAFGVPHIEARTDAAAVFGLAWAQAEDNFWQVEEDLARAIGRASAIHGIETLAHDLVRAAYRVESLSRAEYEREPEDRRRLWQAYADGLNYYLETHPEIRPRFTRRFEPWYVFAVFRAASPTRRVDGVRQGDVLVAEVTPGRESGWSTALLLAEREGAAIGAGESDAGTDEGSNAWAVAPSRTAAGHALLFQNPHVSFFGGGQRYEAHLHSEEGYRVAGFAILATPMIRTGRNDRLGWTHTNTAADSEDAFRITFADPADPRTYVHADTTAAVVEWEDTIRVRVDTTVIERRFRFRRTHHGPIHRLEDGGHAAVRAARFEEGGSLQQWYAMGRADDLASFRAALAGTAFPISNTMYADADGNIFYVHGNAVPRRSPGHDWTAPVDGSDPDTDWQGYHELDELPQLLNPPSGWIQNTNATPFLATAEGHNLARDAYPAYMAREADNARARVSREILSANERWTFDEWAAAAFDTRMIEAPPHLPEIVDEWERLGASDPDRAFDVDAAVEALRGWDGIAREDSPATTLFVEWFDRYRRADADTGEFPRIRALEAAVAGLRAVWDTALVPWGEINRLQRVHTSGREPFDDSAPSIPVAGAPGWTGIVFNVTGRPGPEGRRRYGVSGHTWVGIVNFAPEPEARTIVTFGQSADPASSHWFDQAPLYAKGRFKPAWFSLDDVRANARRSYRPGPESAETTAAGG